MTRAAQEQSWTTRSLLEWMIDTFASRGVDSPRVTSEMLLTHVLSCDRMRLYMEVDRPATLLERDRLRELVRRVLRDEPVQYLVGEGSFYGRMFKVSPVTLIPRPCTETIVEEAVNWARGKPDTMQDPIRVADVGTGSGCIAITLAHELISSFVVATDIDPTILELARTNATTHKVMERLDLREGSLLQPLGREKPLDIVCSNPPYVPDDEWEGGLVGKNVKGHEPERALRGGADGLKFIRPIVEGAGEVLRPGGLLLVEIPSSRAEESRAIASDTNAFADIRIIQDGDGLDRVLRADLKN